MSVEVAGGGRLTAASNAVWQEDATTTVKRKENIARPKREKKPTVKLKTAVGTAKNKKRKKTWMMRLQHPGAHGLWRY
jgi:hypothetical protein